MLAFPPDFTFLIELGSFFVLLFFLNRLLFRPYMDLLDERERRSSGDRDLARAQVAEAEQLKAHIEGELAKGRALVREEVDRIRRRTKEEESRLFEDARMQAAERLKTLRTEIDQAKKQAARTLGDDTRRMAEQMVDAILGVGEAS